MFTFENGRMIIDFIAMNEFILDYLGYLIVGFVGFFMGRIMQLIKDHKKQKEIIVEDNYYENESQTL